MDDNAGLSHKLSHFASGSLILRTVNSIFAYLRALALSSGICTFFINPERVSALFFHSVFGGIAAAVPDAFTRVLKRAGAFLNRAMEKTLTLWALTWLGERFGVFFALFAAAHALTPFALYRNPYTVAALAFLFISACARAAFTKGPSSAFNLKRADPVFILYFASVALSAVYSMFGAGGGAASLTTSVLYLTSISFAFLIANAYHDHRRLLTLLRVLIGAAALVALYGIYQYFQGIPIDVTQTDQTTGGASLAMGRADSTLGNPNVLAAWLLLTIPFSAAFAFFAKNPLRKTFAASLTLVQAACLLLTQSRSSWVGLFAAGAAFVFLLDWRLIPLFAAVGFISIPVWPNFILDRLMTAGSDTSSVYRFTIYAGAFRMALSNWATGVGIGLEYFKRYINNYVYFAYETSPVHSHNLYLQIWLESGAIAVLSFLWALLRLIKKGGAQIFAIKRRYGARSAISGHGARPRGYARLARGGQAYEARMLLTACVSATLGFLTMGLFEYVWFFPRCMNYFFMIIGVFFCAVNLNAQYAQPAEPAP